MGSARYVYAIVSRDARLPARGEWGSAAELEMVPWGELAAVTGRREEDGAPASMEDVLRHEAVVEAVRRAGPALPVRFGTVFRDADSVVRALTERYEVLAGDLERLGEKLEMSLTALWSVTPGGDAPATAATDEGATTGGGAGGQYLRARAAAARRDDVSRERAWMVAQVLDRVLGGLALDRRVSLLPTPRIAVRTAYLVEPGGVGAFREGFEAVRPGRGDLRLLLTGPWPPYSFVTRPAGEGGATPDGRLAALVQLLWDEVQVRHG